jgi:hypothetical protein
MGRFPEFHLLKFHPSANLSRDRIGWPEAMTVATWPVVRWGGYTLTLLYVIYYFSNAATPGNSVKYPLGWWGWWDQSQYIASARNVLAGNLTPDGHWYPLGYSIVAAPFVRFWPAHGFFFLDLACLLGAYAGFLSFARRAGVDPFATVVIFILATFAYASIGQTWAEPWNSTLLAALIWGLLFSAASLLPGQETWQPWRLTLLGLLAASVPLVRPTDAVLSVTAVGLVLVAGLNARLLRVQHLLWMALGAAVAVVPYAVLYLRIYGFHLTPYVLHERTLGFVFSRLGWKTYLLLIEPRPWYTVGESLLTRFPWLVLSFAEFVLLAVRSPRQKGRAALILLGIMILAYWGLYFAYVDLLPSNIWRYHVVHYLKWSLPGLGLLAWLFVLRVWRRPRWHHGLVLLLVICILSVRMVPVRAAPDDTVEMVQYAASPTPGWDQVYQRDWSFTDALGSLGELGIRALPDSQGVRLLPQRRSIVGVLTWADPPVEVTGPGVRWASRVEIGYPCWLPPYPCRRLQPNG